VGAATIVFFISLFLPWFTSSAGIYSASVNGLWPGYMYIGLILALAVIAYLVLRAGFDALPFRLPLDLHRPGRRGRRGRSVRAAVPAVPRWPLTGLGESRAPVPGAGFTLRGRPAPAHA
jgi:hypothetical protein